MVFVISAPLPSLGMFINDGQSWREEIFLHSIIIVKFSFNVIDFDLHVGGVNMPCEMS